MATGVHARCNRRALGPRVQPACTPGAIGGSLGDTSETAVRIYDHIDVAVFSHSWPQGANGTAATDLGSFRQAHLTERDEPMATGSKTVSSCFPSLDTTGASAMGFVTFAGRFLEASREGAFRRELPGQGPAGGPFVVFGKESPDALVFSAASNIMAASWGAEGSKQLCSGLMSTVTEVPKGYAMETMVYLGSGINGAVRGYGQALMQMHGTKRLTEADATLQYLGYSTDHGAYY